MNKETASDPMHCLNRIFEKFEQQELKLTKLGKQATTTVEQMMMFLRTERLKVFDHEDKLYKALDAFKKIMRYIDHSVIYIDLQRHKFSQPEKLAQQALKQAELAHQQRILPSAISATSQQQTAPSDHGLWCFLGERRRMVALERIAGMKREPELTMPRRQQDFMNYAKEGCAFRLTFQFREQALANLRFQSFASCISCFLL